MYYCVLRGIIMFGYIRTDTPELRVRENEYYRAVYCGLCRSQGRCTGQCSRMTLSYDITFLALLRLAISNEKPEIKVGRCIAHPFKKLPYVTECDALSYCAYASALLIYGKTVDDIIDEKGFRRAKAKLIKPFVGSMRKKALKDYAQLDKKIARGLKRLAETEKKSLPSVDIPAECFGEILADIMSHGLVGKDEVIMRNIGLHVGKWIYMLDACDDLSEDIEKGRFNPFICLYGSSPLSKEIKDDIVTSLKLELLAAEPAFDLIDFDGKSDIEGIIRNIIYRGMPDTAERILEINGKSRGSKKQNKKKGLS